MKKLNHTIIVITLLLFSVPSIAEDVDSKGFYAKLGINLGDTTLSCTLCTEVSYSAGPSVTPSIGYHFNSWRFEYMYMNYSYDFNGNEVTLNLFNVDYIFSNGVLLGFGLGSGKVVNSTSSENGSASRFNVGYTNDFNEKIAWSLGLASNALSRVTDDDIRIARTGLEGAIIYKF